MSRTPSERGSVLAAQGERPTPSPDPSSSVPARLGSAAPTPASAPREVEDKKRIPAIRRRLELRDTITGEISPKSVVASGDGLFFAQNMMYRHTITAYDRRGRLRAGEHAYVSNHSMYGAGFGGEGSDMCAPGDGTDHSYVYRIDTATLEIDDVIEVGAVPKYVAVSPDGRWVLVTNWCTYDLTVIDAAKGREVRRVDIGAYRRGIVIDPASETAYVAVMGSTHIVVVDLGDLSVSTIDGVGGGPRDLRMGPGGAFLYATLNAEGTVAKIHRRTGKVRAKVRTGAAPRSLAISGDGTAEYVVNYNSDTVSKIRTRDMRVVQTVDTNDKPIGITYDAGSRQLWVACYSGAS
ncbi:MAG: YncE family protein [Aldersonia sp.]|nr:YncE family protein [Aldersonia sp.]